MSNWFHRLFNPHCSHCHDEREESRVCQSCETLRKELERVTYENNKLLDRLLERPIVEERSEHLEPKLQVPRNVPWNVRRQMLEQEDRERARLIREAAKPIPTEDLERELDVASEKREATR